MNKLSEKVALVTGASRGIGRAIAESFLEEGAKVALCARSVPQLESIADAWNGSNRRALAVECDVSSRDSVDAAITEIERAWGKLHVIVNNAGISARTPMDEDLEESWQQILDVNLNGSYRVTRRALGLMTSGGSRIVNISSVLGRFGVPGYAAYCTAKHGILGFTRALALELAPRAITVNAICPGWVDTDMADQGIQDISKVLGVTPEAFKEEAIKGVPLGRFIDPQEVAKLALYLCSDDASMVTGQTYNICGGQVMN